MSNIFNCSKEIYMRKTPIKIISWITIIIIIFIVFIISLFIPYDKYLNYYGYVSLENNNYYLNIYMEKKHIQHLNNYLMYIDDKMKKFKIVSINDEIYYEKSKPYYLVKLNVNLENELLIENNIINISFKIRRTTLKDEFISIIKEAVYATN